LVNVVAWALLFGVGSSLTVYLFRQMRADPDTRSSHTMIKVLLIALGLVGFALYLALRGLWRSFGTPGLIVSFAVLAAFAIVWVVARNRSASLGKQRIDWLS